MSRGNLKYSEKERFFDNVDIITSRPEGMSKEDYKARMKAQKKTIKQYLKGELVHLSKIYPTEDILAYFGLSRNSSTLEIFAKAREDKKFQAAMLLLKGLTYERPKEA